MNISPVGIALIQKFEGCKLTAYNDAVGVLTIGYGCTTNVEPGMTITQSEAEYRLKKDVSHAEKCVNSAVSVPLTQGEFDALVSFVFNLGCGAFRKSTLLRKLLDSDFDGAAGEFKRWNRAGQKILPGLVARRKSEAELFLA